MKRRVWAALLLVLVNISALFFGVPTALAVAASGTYTFTSATQITESGGPNDGMVFTNNGSGTVYSWSTTCHAPGLLMNDTISIMVGAKNKGGGYAGVVGTVNNGCTGYNGNTGSIADITDPNNYGPGGGNPGPSPSPTTTSPSPSPASSVTCDAGSMTWALCPIITAMADVVDGLMTDVIQPFLKVSPLATTVKDSTGKSITNPTFVIWGHMRDVASVGMILVFFAIIFGTALGFNNYTIKKVLPHLVAGAVLIPFSWYICAVAVDIGNVLGQGFLALADSFIPAPQIDFSTSISQLLGVAGILATTLIVLKGAVTEIGVAVLLTVLFAVLATFFTLVLRQILIILLVIISPFAFLLWILPNTEKFYKQWWTNLLKLILMYPMIMMLFEAGRIFSLTAGSTFAPAGGGVADDLQKAAIPFLALAGLFLPLGAVPWTFAWAGGAMKAGSKGISSLQGAANKRWGRGSSFDHDRKERRAEKGASSWAGRPVTRLGQAMQAKDANGEYKHKGLASLNQRLAASRAGMGGAVIGTKPNAAQQRKLIGMHEKSVADEASAEGFLKSRQAQMSAGTWQSHKELVDQRAESIVAEGRNKKMKDLVTMGQRVRGNSGFTHDEWHALAMGAGVGINGETLVGDDLHDAGKKQAFMQKHGLSEADFNSRRGSVQIGDQVYKGPELQQAAVNHVAGNLGDYSDILNHMANQSTNLSEQTLTASTLASGLQGTGSEGKSRTLALGVESALTDPGYFQDDLKRRQYLSGRRAEQFSGFDKQEKWEYIAQLDALDKNAQRLAADPGASQADRQKAAETLDSIHGEVYRNLSTVLSTKPETLDPRTLDFVKNIDATTGVGALKDAAGNTRQVRFSPAEAQVLRGYFDATGQVKRPVQEVVVRQEGGAQGFTPRPTGTPPDQGPSGPASPPPPPSPGSPSGTGWPS